MGHDPSRELFVERGRLHEARYVESLRGEGLHVVDLSGAGHDDIDRTVESMRSGADALVQAPLRMDGWRGRADVLRRVERASRDWQWSYEVVDTKLARRTKVGTVVQLVLYSDWVEFLQGVRPERFHVVMPGEAFRIESLRVADYEAYVRHARRRFERALTSDLDEAVAASRPEPCDHCEVCRWWLDCRTRWREEDHLSLVAGLTRLQRGELNRVGVDSLGDLATRPDRLPLTPEVGAPESYVRAHRQARVQWRGRDSGGPTYELLEGTPTELGLADLPLPNRHDLFLDLEGDPFVGTRGREYLFGLAWEGVDGAGSETAAQYRAHWALTAEAERAAFESMVDEIMRRLQIEPTMHVYHFGAYEPAALKRLVGRYATRVDELDRLLRGEVLIDLHRVVKRTLRASVESYSLKELEPFFGFHRELELRDARSALRRVEAALELEQTETIEPGVRAAVEAYNADDCRATQALRDWLERLRAEVERSHDVVLPRPEPKSGDPTAAVSERDAEVDEVMAALLAGVPDDPSKRSPDQDAKFQLAHMLEFHRREQKASYWEFFRLRDLREDLREDERAVVANLEHAGTTVVKRSLVHRYRFAPQETAVKAGDTAYDAAGDRRGEVVACDGTTRELSIKVTQTKWAEFSGHPEWMFVHKERSPQPKPAALLRFARSFAGSPLDGGENDPWEAARALLMRAPPRLRVQAVFPAQVGESAQARALRVVVHLDRSVLPIQGPPGTGKTHTGAEMILRLVQAGMRVGVTAMSHAVIRNLLDRVVETAERQGVEIGVGAKVTRVADEPGSVREASDNRQPLSWLMEGEVAVLGGTTWLWARPEYEQTVDVLFVDEAGQLALADVLAVAGSAKSLVLLGDPQQLEQPRKASHPEGTDLSALGHVLAGAPTIDAERGIFLEETWRLPPSICAMTSDLFYSGRLRGRAELDRRKLVGTGDVGLDGAGLWYLPVEHVGRSVVAPEEIEAIDTLVVRLLDGVNWVDMNGETHVLSGEEILVIAPYNAQVGALSERLAMRSEGVRVGTVDRFQGQQAAVVIFSATSSTADDAPRGMKFLYSSHRFNVATSRARVACVIVATERLFEPECRSTEQLRLANALCRFRELANVCAPTQRRG